MAKAKETEEKKKPAKAAKKAVKVESLTEAAPEEILKTKKVASKAAKKAAPKTKKAKAEAKADEPEKEAKPKKPVHVQKRRSRLERRGKKYREAYQTVEHGKLYSLKEAIGLLPKTSYVKFDPSVELHINLGADPKQADQMVRSTTVLPHGTGKSQRVAVLADGDDVKKAEAAGADRVGMEDILKEIEAEKIDFDVLIATPKIMAQLGKYAKVLGPKGLMPNPKSGTVAPDVAKAVKELKAGRIEFRMDKQGIIHQLIGKLSFAPAQLNENATALFAAIKAARPANIKGQYVNSATICVSMGPPIKLDSSAIINES